MNTIIKDLICGWIQIPGNHLISDILAALNPSDPWPRTTSKGVGVVSLVAGGRLHACVAHDSYHSLGEIGTDGTCGVGSLSFFREWVDGRAGSSQRCCLLFSFGSVSCFLRTPHLSDISGDTVVIFSACICCNFICLEDVPLNSI